MPRWPSPRRQLRRSASAAASAQGVGGRTRSAPSAHTVIASDCGCPSSAPDDSIASVARSTGSHHDRPGRSLSRASAHSDIAISRPRPECAAAAAAGASIMEALPPSTAVLVARPCAVTVSSPAAQSIPEPAAALASVLVLASVPVTVLVPMRATVPVSMPLRAAVFLFISVPAAAS
eukprot:364001-Chlamydomonas_euryale.AAC.1